MAGELFRAGYLTRPEQLVRIQESVENNSGLGRLLHISLYGGLQVNIHLDRGVDIGDTWYQGKLISWMSRVRDAGALTQPAGNQWLSRFNGGLLTTCGLENIGPATAEHGLHGSFSHRRGHDVRYRREVSDDRVACEVTASISEMQLFGRAITCYRTIRLEAGPQGASLAVSDHVVNESLSEQALAVLYHINLGYPVLQPGTRVKVNADSVLARSDHPEVPDAGIFPAPLEYESEAVFEYSGFESTQGRADVSTAGEPRVRVQWQRDELPKFFQWVYPSKGGWALGLEPANAPMWGSERESETRGMKLLGPGESMATAVSIHFEH